jgi:hypothetical protein
MLSEPPLEDPNAPLTVLTWAFGTDTGLLLPAYFATLGFLIAWGAQTFRRREREMLGTLDEKRYWRYARVARYAAWALILVAAADLVENYLAVTRTTDAWFALEAGGQVNVPSFWAHALGTATFIKLVLVLVTVGYGALVWMLIVRHGGTRDAEWSGVRGGWRTFLALRLQFLVVIGLAATLLIHEQVPDVLRRWADFRVTGAASVLLMLGLAFAVWHSAKWMVVEATATSSKGSKIAAWILAIAAGALALLIGLPKLWGPTLRLTAPFLIVAVVAGLSWPIRGLPGKKGSPPPPGAGRYALPRLLAATVMVVLGLAVLRAWSVNFLYTQVRGRAIAESLLFMVLAVGLVLSSAAVSWVLRHWERPRLALALRPRWWPSLVLLACVSVWMASIWTFYLWGQTIGPAVGSIGIVAAFFILLTYTGSSVIAVADTVVDEPAPLFRAVGLRRAPVLSLVAAWFLIASFLPFDEAFHDVRPTGSPTNDLHPRELLSEAFVAWVAENCLLSDTDVTTTAKKAVPLVLVASSGGGIRAAVWTAYVLDRTLGYPEVDEARGPTDSPPECSSGPPGSIRPSTYSHWVFGMSGVSGGTLGVAAYLSQLSLSPSQRTPAVTRDSGTEGWIEQRLGEDFLAPSLGWMLFAESAWSLLRFGGDLDRGRVLERAWERPWPAGIGMRKGLFDLRASHPKLPLLIANGTSVETGCRLQTSVLNASERPEGAPAAECLAPLLGTALGEDALGATVDAVDFLCNGQDLKLSTVALLSARFPIVSPAGHLAQCEELGNSPRPETSVVDGGYLENSGAGTALDLWASLAPLVEDHNRNAKARACIVPFFVQINNGYGEPAAPAKVGTPAQFVAPISALNATRDGRTAAARQTAQLLFNRRFTLGVESVTSPHAELLDDEGRVADRYAQFSLFAHPGAQAPLGWTLSKSSMEELVDQFGERDPRRALVNENQAALTEFETWFDGLTCIVES